MLKIAQSNKGKKRTDEQKRSLSLAHKNNKAVFSSIENLKKATIINIGRRKSQQEIEKQREGLRRHWENPETKIKASLRCRGDKGTNWQGGKTAKNKSLRNSIQFRLWREAVFSRDNWACQECGKRGVFLHPHHIKQLSTHPELAFAIDNGITYCAKCHQHLHGNIKLSEVSNG